MALTGFCAGSAGECLGSLASLEASISIGPVVTDPEPYEAGEEEWAPDVQDKGDQHEPKVKVKVRLANGKEAQDWICIYLVVNKKYFWGGQRWAKLGGRIWLKLASRHRNKTINNKVPFIHLCSTSSKPRRPEICRRNEKRSSSTILSNSCLISRSVG